MRISTAVRSSGRTVEPVKGSEPLSPPAAVVATGRLAAGVASVGSAGALLAEATLALAADACARGAAADGAALARPLLARTGVAGRAAWAGAAASGAAAEPWGAAGAAARAGRGAGLDGSRVRGAVGRTGSSADTREIAWPTPRWALSRGAFGKPPPTAGAAAASHSDPAQSTPTARWSMFGSYPPGPGSSRARGR